MAKYITRVLRFENGEMTTPNEAGWANWHVVAVLKTEHSSSGGKRIQYVECLIEDTT
jgi:hypothetical protein